MNRDFFTFSEDDEDIDFGEVLFVLKNNVLALVLCALIGACAAFGYTSFFITPEYSSSSMIYIFSNTKNTAITENLQLGLQLTVDFEILGTSRTVLEQVIENLSLNTDYEDLLEMVEVENPEDSRIIKITVNNSDPQLAADIANETANVLADEVVNIIETDKPSTVEAAVPAEKPASPSKKKNTLIGFAAGLLLAAFVIMIRYYGDMSIKDEDDVRKYLDLDTLALFPLDSDPVKVK